jgi:hypothetical protein
VTKSYYLVNNNETNTNQSDDFNLRLDAEEDSRKLPPIDNQSVLTNNDHDIGTAKIHESNHHLSFGMIVPTNKT